MSNYSIVVGDIIDESSISRGANPRLEFSRRVERVPVARNESEALLENEAYFHLMSTLPSVYKGLFLTSIDGKPNGIDGWVYRISYTKRRSPRYGFMDYSGDSTGGTAKRTRSYETVGKYGRTADAKIPNFHNGINWNGNYFEGIEVPTPSYQWSETWGHPLNIMSNPYIALCRSGTAAYNTTPFRGFMPGEVLFTGITDTFEFVEEEDCYYPIWKITYHFKVSPNMDDIQVEGIKGPITKLGHDALWIFYAKEVETETKKVIGKPEFAYVERVLERFDFAALGIGVGSISDMILGVSG